MQRRSCACGCGQPITGRKSKRFLSDACRKWANRTPTPHQNVPIAGPVGRETRTTTAPVQSTGGTVDDVRELDTKSRDVYCAVCGSPMPKLRGPLPVAAYSNDCVVGGRCLCASRRLAPLGQGIVVRGPRAHQIQAAMSAQLWNRSAQRVHCPQ